MSKTTRSCSLPTPQELQNTNGRRIHLRRESMHAHRWVVEAKNQCTHETYRTMNLNRSSVSYGGWREGGRREDHTAKFPGDWLLLKVGREMLYLFRKKRLLLEKTWKEQEELNCWRVLSWTNKKKIVDNKSKKQTKRMLLVYKEKVAAASRDVSGKGRASFWLWIALLLVFFFFFFFFGRRRRRKRRRRWNSVADCCCVHCTDSRADLVQLSRRFIAPRHCTVFFFLFLCP